MLIHPRSVQLSFYIFQIARFGPIQTCIVGARTQVTRIKDERSSHYLITPIK